MPKSSAGPAVGCSSNTTRFTTLIIPANDSCDGAITLTVNPTSTMTTTTSFVTTNASQSLTGCTGTADDDVWFKFVATSTSHNFVLSSSTSADLVHEVFSGSCGSLTSVYCSDPNASSSNCFTPGETYYVRVYSYGNATAAGTVTIGVGTIVFLTDATCATSSQICAPFTFTAGVNQPSGGGGCGADYGCVYTQPNPEYHWIEVVGNGNIKWNIDNTAGIDVDYVVWGPFASPPNPNSARCGTAGTMAVTCGASLGLPFPDAGASTTSTSPHGCDYSTDRGGNVNIDNVVAGQYYLLLITNYANSPTTINVTQLAGNTAAIACPCLISDITATPSACGGATNYYTLSGLLTYNNAPASGTLTISDNNGNMRTYTYPFPASPIAYSIPSNTSDGTVHTITAVFSASTQCTRCINYTAPSACCTVPTPTLANIVDNSCGYTFDLVGTAGGGGPYEWSTDPSFTSTLTSTTSLYLPTPTASIIYYVRKVGQTCAASILVNDPTPSTTLTAGNCNVCTVYESSTRTFYDSSNYIIGTLTDAAGGSYLGLTTACAFVDSGAQSVGGQHYMQRHYSFEVTNNGPAMVTIYLSEADVSDLIGASSTDGPTYGIFTGMADICVMQYDGLLQSPQSHLSENMIPHSALTITGPDHGIYSVTFFVSGFSGFYCFACNPMGNALPVEWMNFNGYHDNGSNILKWNTLTEVNNNHFEVERSVDGSNWKKIGEDIKGANNSTQLSSYNFIDDKLESDIYYYRIKQVDNDAKFTYSNIIEIQTESVSINNVFPNPASDKIYYTLSSATDMEIGILIMNMDGQIVKSNHHSIFKGNNNLKENIEDLTSGVYILRVTEFETGNTTVNKFIKK